MAFNPPISQVVDTAKRGVKLSFLENLELCLPANYVRRLENEYFDDQNSQTDLIWQPDVYTFAQNYAKRQVFAAVVDLGSGSGTKLLNFEFDGPKIGIDLGSNLMAAKSRHPNIKWLEADLNEKLTDELKNQIPHGSLIICSDVIEHLTKPESLLRSLQALVSSGIAKSVVMSTPERDRARGQFNFGPPDNPAHTMEWALAEFECLLSKNGLDPFIHGHTRNFSGAATRNTQIALIDFSMNAALVEAKKQIKPTIQLFMPVFNEHDILEQVVVRFLRQGFKLHILDNWSDDGSFEIVQRLAHEHANLTFERFPEKPSREFQWELILRRIESLCSNFEADWFGHVDADEFFESFAAHIDILDTFNMAGLLGYTAFDCTLLDIRPTSEVKPGSLPEHFEFSIRAGAKHIERFWKNDGRAPEFHASGGHQNLAHTRLFPLNLALLHFPIRSREQAVKKIFRDRLPRAQKEMTEKGWHVQYGGFHELSDFIWDSGQLSRISNTIAAEYLPEITTRAGIPF